MPETVAAGRQKRSTAGNRYVQPRRNPPSSSTETATLSMRELLEKAHQEDDELFAEAENDEDFEAPREFRQQFTYVHKVLQDP